MSISKIKIQHVVREMDLAEFQPEYAGQSIKVWVNPPMNFKSELQARLLECTEATAKSLLVQNPIKFLKETGQNLPEDDRELEKLKKGTPEEIEAALEVAREAKKRYYACFAEVWEGDSEEDVLALAEQLEQSEPALLLFLRKRTMEMIGEYANTRKKA